MNGWPVFGWAALAVLTVVGAVLGIAGTDEPGLRMAIRATARTSVVLFSFAFAASALRRRWPSPATRWLVRNRRQLGVGFAFSHLLHLIAIVALAGWSWRGVLADTSTLTLVAGGGAYLLIALMTLTSFDRTATWLGPAAWRRLHTTGAYYVWIVFAQNVLVMAFLSPFYWPYAALLAGAMAVRWLPAPRPAAAELAAAGRAA